MRYTISIGTWKSKNRHKYLLQYHKKLKAVNRINDKEQRIMRDIDHKISHDIAAEAIKHNVKVIKLNSCKTSVPRQEQAAKTAAVCTTGLSIGLPCLSNTRQDWKA